MAVNLFVDMFAVLLFLFVYVVNSVSADDVVGCGGFVKSDVDINYSFIEVYVFVNIYFE